MDEAGAGFSVSCSVSEWESAVFPRYRFQREEGKASSMRAPDGMIARPERFTATRTADPSQER